MEEVNDNPVIAPKANDGAYKTIDIYNIICMLNAIDVTVLVIRPNLFSKYCKYKIHVIFTPIQINIFTKF